MPTGKYIVIEGGDGTGKTTQADMLQKHLESQDINVIHLKEPGGSPVAEAIRSVIVDGTLPRTPMTNILLFTANRHELWHDRIKPALEAGTWVIATRNYWSTLVYQGHGEGVSESIITAITATFTEQAYMNPDYGFILSLDDLATSKDRISERGALDKPDTFESKGTDFQQRIHDGYLAIAETYHLPIISASQPIEVVAEAIRDQLHI
ncbi:MAG: tmk [Candidatus Saccharibacteria bacterium]|nr:tmk [Candidatus Saccharibacteria bacterium]